MPIANQAVSQYTEDICSSLVMSETSGPAGDGIVYFGPKYAGPYKGFVWRVKRSAETGTCTLDFNLQTWDQTAGEWTDWLDTAGSINLLLPQWADGSTVVKWMKVYPGALSSDADNVLIVGTANRVYNEVWWAPMRAKVTTGGTTVTNTVTISLTYLP